MKKIFVLALLLALVFASPANAAFDIGGFKLIGKSQAAGQNLYSYTSPDLRATIKASSYFNNVAPYTMREGDIIFVTIDNDGTIDTATLVVNDVTAGVVTTTESLKIDRTRRISVPLASVFVDGTGPITSSTAPNLTTVDNVGAIVYDSSGETAEIQFSWAPGTYLSAMTVNLICTSSDASGASQAVDWSIFVHGDDADIPTALAQTGASLSSATLDASEELVTLTLDATGIAAITAGTSGVGIAVWNNGTSDNTLEIKQIFIEETL